MPATDPPPAVTADGLAAALRLIDRHLGAIKTGLSYWPPSGEVAAALAIARDEIAQRMVLRDPSSGGDFVALVESQDAHIAALAALATATGHATATAGEGAS